MAINTAVLVHGIRLLSELDEIVLTREALPSLRSNPRRVDTASGTTGTARRKRNRGLRAVGIGTVVSTRHTQVRRQRDGLQRICHAAADGRTAARRRRSAAVSGTASIVNHMGTGVLVTGRIRLYHIPTEEREDLVEPGVAAQVCVVEVGETAVTKAVIRGNQRQARFTTLT